MATVFNLSNMIQPGDFVYLNKDKPPFKKGAQGRVRDVLPSGLIILNVSKDENCLDASGIVFVMKEDLTEGVRCH